VARLTASGAAALLSRLLVRAVTPHGISYLARNAVGGAGATPSGDGDAERRRRTCLWTLPWRHDVALYHAHAGSFMALLFLADLRAGKGEEGRSVASGKGNQRVGLQACTVLLRVLNWCVFFNMDD